jgi:hypothetical protein
VNRIRTALAIYRAKVREIRVIKEATDAAVATELWGVR